jgi:hypothetical protein
MAGTGPGLLDLAALVAGWGPNERSAIVTAYRVTAERNDEEFDAELDRCRLQLALQRMSWAPGWRPPPEHDHDWIADALEVSRALGLDDR